MSVAPLRVSAITFDFGNTLVRVGKAGLRSVVEDAADALVALGHVHDRASFIQLWGEERDRQFEEDVPEFREPDIPRRATRVFARARGMPAPPRDARWDDVAAARLVDPAEVEAVVDIYSRAFIDRIAPDDDALPTLERLAGRGFVLGILSNWPLAVAIDRFATAHGWLPFLRAVVVSERVGTIKPHQRIFRTAEAALGSAPGTTLHVGDDWAADVVGARGAGWHAGYLRNRQHDTPLPTSDRSTYTPVSGGGPVTADLEIDELTELDALVNLAGP